MSLHGLREELKLRRRAFLLLILEKDTINSDEIADLAALQTAVLAITAQIAEDGPWLASRRPTDELEAN